MITIQQAERIINELNDEFDSHDFIEKYIAHFEREYVEMLAEKIDNEQIFRTVNSLIARFLADKHSRLGIEKNGRESSQNVKGNDTENQRWIRSQRHA